jgi:hypothetical protein
MVLSVNYMPLKVTSPSFFLSTKIDNTKMADMRPLRQKSGSSAFVNLGPGSVCRLLFQTYAAIAQFFSYGFF